MIYFEFLLSGHKMIDTNKSTFLKNPRTEFVQQLATKSVHLNNVFNNDKYSPHVFALIDRANTIILVYDFIILEKKVSMEYTLPLSSGLFSYLKNKNRFSILFKNVERYQRTKKELERLKVTIK